MYQSILQLQINHATVQNLTEEDGVGRWETLTTISRFYTQSIQ